MNGRQTFSSSKMSLFEAVKENNYDSIQRLLMAESTNQTAFDQVNEHGENLLMAAAKAGSIRTFQLLVEIAKLGLERAQTRGYTDGSLADSDSEIRLPSTLINRRDKSGRTAVHHAVSSLSMPILKRLIKMDARLDVQDKKGNTALHLAAHLPHSLGELKFTTHTTGDSSLKKHLKQHC